MEARVVKFELKGMISGMTGRSNLDRTLVQQAFDANETLTERACATVHR